MIEYDTSKSLSIVFESAIHFCLLGNGCLVPILVWVLINAMWLIVVIKMGPYNYIHGYLGSFYPDFTVCSLSSTRNWKILDFILRTVQQLVHHNSSSATPPHCNGKNFLCPMQASTHSDMTFEWNSF